MTEPIPEPFPDGPWRWEDLRWRERIGTESAELVREAVRRAVDLRDWSDGTGLTSSAPSSSSKCSTPCVTPSRWTRQTCGCASQSPVAPERLESSRRGASHT